MKFLWTNLGLLLAFLLCGCGVNKNSPQSSSTLPSPSPPPGSSTTSENWVLDATSSAGMLLIAGNINLSGSSLSGSAHVTHSTCFDPQTTIAFAGSVSSGGDVQLNSVSVAGQIIALNGTVDGGDGLTGSYSITGGCADGDQGTINGSTIGYIGNILNGTFTSSSGQIFDISGNIAQNAGANADGSYGISGTVTFTGSCLSSGTLPSGGLQSGSFIVGASVGLQVQTENGTLFFLGQLKQATGELNGRYTLSGGTCDQSGKAALIVSSPWNY